MNKTNPSVSNTSSLSQCDPANREALTECVISLIRAKRSELNKTHLDKLTGLSLLKPYTDFMDGLLIELFTLLAGAQEGVKKDTSLVTLGGYGRVELNIHSDIDLMLLYRDTITPEIEEITQSMLYILWDAGLDVGFSIRNIKECVEFASDDTKTKTSFVDARYLHGNKALFADFIEIVKKLFFTGNELDKFIEQKIEEKVKRHEKYGGSVYLLEPNVKEGEGGLRDLHTARWIIMADRFGSPKQAAFDLVESGILNKEENSSLNDSLDFLHWVRNELHFQTKRKTDQLTFGHQEDIAAFLGHKDTDDELAVENFMQRYYRHAANIKSMTTLTMSRYLHTRSGGLSKDKGVKKIDELFDLKDGHVVLKDRESFATHPEAMMKVFEHCLTYDAEIGRLTKDKILENLFRINDEFRESREVGETFRRILSGPGVHRALTRMQSLAFLELYIPEFSRITCKVQHDLYHIYTVGTHSIFTVREMKRLSNDQYKKDYPLHAELFEQIEDKSALMLATLLHDVGKGDGKGHAEKGAAMAPEICRRIGMDEDETRLVVFLIRYHLMLPNTAQYRDLHDAKLIIDFSKKVGSVERLKYLFLLTFADTRAVGPDVWTQWKSALFQELYFASLTVFERGEFELPDANEKIDRTRQQVKQILTGENELPDTSIAEHISERVDNHFKVLQRRYILMNTPEDIARHLMAIESLVKTPSTLEVVQFPEREYTELIICTLDVHGLFSIITGVMAANSINILGAHVTTLKNGIALDVLEVTNAYGGLVKAKSKLKQINKDLSDVLTGKRRIEDLMSRVKPSILDSKQKPGVTTSVLLDNNISDIYTVLDILSEDKIGLLYKISSALTNLGVVIQIAKISTKGGTASDIFYIRDIFGKINDSEKLSAIKESLLRELSV